MQSSLKSQRGRGGRPTGALAVETAIVLPLFFLFVFGLLEFGRCLLVADTIVGAAQEGCRAAIVPGATSSDVTTAANTVLSGGLVSGATVTVSPSNLSQVKTGQPVSVTVQVPFDQVSWLPTPQYLKNKVLKSTCIMLREGT
jgi:Flp pilus assembly protein TadG